MVSLDAISAVSEQIVKEFQPERIVLFGSYATGTARPDSDVDLLVVMAHQGHSAYMAAEILTHIDPNFPVDLLVRTPVELETRLALGDSFLRTVIEQGKVLYAASHR